MRGLISLLFVEGSQIKHRYSTFLIEEKHAFDVHSKMHAGMNVWGRAEEFLLFHANISLSKEMTERYSCASFGIPFHCSSNPQVDHEYRTCHLHVAWLFWRMAHWNSTSFLKTSAWMRSHPKHESFRRDNFKQNWVSSFHRFCLSEIVFVFCLVHCMCCDFSLRSLAHVETLEDETLPTGSRFFPLFQNVSCYKWDFAALIAQSNAVPHQ